MQYTRSECSRLFGISMDALRYFESIGLVKPEKGEGSRRLYSLDQIMAMLDMRKLRAFDVDNGQLVQWYGVAPQVPHKMIYNSVLSNLQEEERRLLARIRLVSGMRDTLEEIEDHLDDVMIGERPVRRFVLFGDIETESIGNLMRDGLPYLNYGYWLDGDSLMHGNHQLNLRIGMDVTPLREVKPELFAQVLNSMPVVESLPGLKLYRYCRCDSLEEITIDDFEPILDYARAHNYTPYGDVFGGIIGPGVADHGNVDGFIITQVLNVR